MTKNPVSSLFGIEVCQITALVLLSGF